MAGIKCALGSIYLSLQEQQDRLVTKLASVGAMRGATPPQGLASMTKAAQMIETVQLA